MRLLLSSCCLTLGLLAALVSDLWLNKAEARKTNDLTQNNGNYQVNGSDPFIVFDTTDSLLDFQSDKHSLIIKLGIQADESQTKETFKAELFFAPGNNQSNSFDPYQRLLLSLPNTSFDQFKIVLPDALSYSKIQRLRLDLIDCSGCTLSLPPVKSVLEHSPRTQLATLDFAYLGINQVPTAGKPLPVEGWHANNMTLTKSGYKIDGGDPYLVSPFLGVNTDQFGGILFEFLVSNSSTKLHDLQLFYATETHRFKEDASQLIRVKEDSGRVRILAPFSFLRDQFPPVSALEQVRLDIASHSVLSGNQSIKGTWQLLNATILHNDQMAEFSDLLNSSRLYSSTIQRNSKRQTFVGIIKKIGRDLGFLVSYILLLGVLVVWLLIKIRGEKVAQ